LGIPSSGALGENLDFCFPGGRISEHPEASTARSCTSSQRGPGCASFQKATDPTALRPVALGRKRKEEKGGQLWEFARKKESTLMLMT